MMLIQLLIIIIIIFLGWPIGIFIAKNTKDELKDGKKCFQILCFVCIIMIVLCLFLLKGNDMIIVEAVLDFILLLSIASLYEANKLNRRR